jgi:hypothetical protein
VPTRPVAAPRMGAGRVTPKVEQHCQRRPPDQDATSTSPSECSAVLSRCLRLVGKGLCVPRAHDHPSIQMSHGVWLKWWQNWGQTCQKTSQSNSLGDGLGAASFLAPCWQVGQESNLQPAVLEAQSGRSLAFGRGRGARFLRGRESARGRARSAEVVHVGGRIGGKCSLARRHSPATTGAGESHGPQCAAK